MCTEFNSKNNDFNGIGSSQNLPAERLTHEILTSFTDKNSNKGKTRCRSKYCPIRVMRSNSAILPVTAHERKKQVLDFGYLP